MELRKTIKVTDDGKHYTNYDLLIEVNGKIYAVAIEPKRFGKDWTDKQVRQSFTLLDFAATIQRVVGKPTETEKQENIF